ncbi:MAG: hypothetical protein V4669_13705 [Pseudomonadota bacterium]
MTDHQIRQLEADVARLKSDMARGQKIAVERDRLAPLRVGLPNEKQAAVRENARIAAERIA